jgi:hypothetical protein
MAGSGVVFMKGYFQSHDQPAIGIVSQVEEMSRSV